MSQLFELDLVELVPRTNYLMNYKCLNFLYLVIVTIKCPVTMSKICVMLNVIQY